MRPTTLQKLLRARSISTLQYGIAIQTKPTWVVSGETRLSYTTLTRLVECCREYHWQTDIAPYLSSTTLDATCKSVSAEFLQPVPVSTTIVIDYEVKQVRNKGYELQFKILSVDQQTIYAIFDIVSIFYNTETNQVAILPNTVFYKLMDLSNRAMLEQNEDDHE